jgi:hypothetical protein
MFRIILGNKYIINTLKKLLLLIFMPFFHANCMTDDKLSEMLKTSKKNLKQIVNIMRCVID